MTVLLLHAFPLDERMWAPQREVLANEDVFAPGLYGRGRSKASSSSSARRWVVTVRSPWLDARRSAYAE